jgi:hypothetical protein
MIVFVTIPKTTYKGRTKSEVLSKAQAHSYISSSSGSYRIDSRNNDEVKVYTLQKVNKKTSQVKRKDSKSEFGKRTVSTVLRRKEWIMTVHTFNVGLLKAMGRKVVQGNQTFELVKK